MQKNKSVMFKLHDCCTIKKRQLLPISGCLFASKWVSSKSMHTSLHDIACIESDVSKIFILIWRGVKDVSNICTI